MDQVQKFLTKLYRQVGSARSRRYSSYVETGQWSLLLEQTNPAPHVYQNAHVFRRDVLVTELTRKLLLPGDSARRREKAIETFWDSESQCASTNARLHRFIHEQGPFEACDEPVISFIRMWRKNIARALGRPSFVLTPRFNPGATLTHGGKLITIPDKMFGEPSVYAHSREFVRPYFYGTPLDKTPKVFDHNKFFTVPKDSVKDRGCGMEASLNVMLQLDVGRRMKTRYAKAYKVDLRHSSDLHRELAKQASMDGSMATIDLSNASDTICKNLVRILLPDGWWELLNSLRAHKTQVDGRIVYLEKFSSMGNGFTFELETFIFRSLLETLGCEIAYCFGDDIIVDTAHSRSVIAALRFFGFTPNERKTFCEGPFRESCGGDFFNGIPVRGHYLKELPDDPQKWVALANGLRRFDPTMKWVGSAWRYAIDQIPRHLRCFGPEDLGDLVIWDPTAEPLLREIEVGCRWERRRELRPVWRILKPITKKLPLFSYWPEDIALLAFSSGVSRDVAFRGNVTGWRTGWLLAYGVGGDPLNTELVVSDRT